VYDYVWTERWVIVGADGEVIPGSEVLGGFSISDPADPTPRYGWHDVRVNDLRMLWVAHDKDGSPGGPFTVVDAIELPSFGDDEALGDGCTLDGVIDSTVAAIGRGVSLMPEQYTDIAVAWYFDRSTESIQRLEPARVTCFNDDWGI
jgi:hypothetical protein